MTYNITCVYNPPVKTSKSLYKKASQLIPGGVNSPVRAFGAVGGNPLFVKKARGAYLWDVDGKRYIDYCLSWGPMLLGHAEPSVVKAIQKAVTRGTSFGISHAEEVELAELIRKFYPSIQKSRLVSSGTGLGLHIVRIFVERMQGDLQFESEEGKGTSVTVTLPLKVTKN